MRVLLLASLLAAVPAAAQARFLPQPDTLFYEGINPHRMYLVRGADTLGIPVRRFAVQRQTWRDSAGTLVVHQRGDEVQVHGRVSRDSARFDGRGAEVDAGGAYSGLMLQLRLPADGDLRPGRVWLDTLDQSRSMDTGHDYIYQLTHELRVERLADTLGSRMAVIRGTGRLRYRQSAPAEPGETHGWWIDVTGPVDESFLFDLDHGRIAERSWWMDLRGISASPDGAGGMDTLPAGLRSSDTTHLVPAERARLVGLLLPVGDTSITAAGQGDIMLHTVRRTGSSIESAMRLNDGTTMTVEARHEDGRAVRYALLRTAAHVEPIRRTVELRDGMLHMGGDVDTAFVLPSGRWAVSDYAMDEHLAGALARMAADGEWEGTIDVLRPFAMRWDRAQAQLLSVKDVFLAVVRVEPDGIRDVVSLLVFTKDGDLLYVEGAEPAASARRPPAGSPRAARVERVLDALRKMADTESAGLPD